VVEVRDGVMPKVSCEGETVLAPAAVKDIVPGPAIEVVLAIASG
jgi:hypothetical protein